MSPTTKPSSQCAGEAGKSVPRAALGAAPHKVAVSAFFAFRILATASAEAFVSAMFITQTPEKSSERS